MVLNMVALLPPDDDSTQVVMEQGKRLVAQAHHRIIQTSSGVEGPGDGAGDVSQRVAVPAQRNRRAQRILGSVKFFL